MFEPLDQLLPIARMAEEYGYEGIGLADHVAVPETFASVHPSGENPLTARSDFPDSFTAMAAMAAVTERLRFMSYVYVLSMRDPLSVAKQVGTLAGLFPGRLRFGIGAGWLAEEIELFGVDPRTRGRRMDEMLGIIADLWDDGWAEHHGEFFDLPRVGMFPVPEDAPPIWVGGRSEAALRRAVRHDGWLGMNYGLDEIEALVARLGDLRRDADDRRSQFEVFVIPNAQPTAALHDRLAEIGVTSTMVMPWIPGDPAAATLDAKRRAMEQLAERLELRR
ncbi:TIGR03619 family F420-dependent LLM class oxidoreductase [Rhabdothermincola salaria]|uniref:TIGR03619 family F420-dependent LLM class oxidoreductase n=1 Tax=Rhabdothermincola salaria TaxID=2903142 RepID=UPI001E59FFD3|nr:TIGR03619 family F420-dependent LLM class oxidoreductase [Rhabdothermincola salaria]MCD9623835.1 TIGR03619 family F420-dependent LLM class oxidoreductase [Rhabdothermincola salaria]